MPDAAAHDSNGEAATRQHIVVVAVQVLVDLGEPAVDVPQVNETLRQSFGAYSEGVKGSKNSTQLVSAVGVIVDGQPTANVQQLNGALKKRRRSVIRSHFRK